MAQLNSRTGEVHVNQHGQHFIIVEYINNKKVVAWCAETQQLRRSPYFTFRKGRVTVSKRNDTTYSAAEIQATYGVDVDKIYHDYLITEELKRAEALNSVANCNHANVTSEDIAECYKTMQDAAIVEQLGTFDDDEADTGEELQPQQLPLFRLVSYTVFVVLVSLLVVSLITLAQCCR